MVASYLKLGESFQVWGGLVQSGEGWERWLPLAGDRQREIWQEMGSS